MRELEIRGLRDRRARRFAVRLVLPEVCWKHTRRLRSDTITRMVDRPMATRSPEELARLGCAGVVDVRGTLWVDPDDPTVRFERVGDDLWITEAWEVRAPRLTYSSLSEGGRTTVWPRAVPVTTAARVLTLVPVTDAGGGGP